MDSSVKKFSILKKIFFLLFFISVGLFSHAQIFKNIADGLKNNLENTATDKLNQQINKGVDSITKAHPKKKSKHPADTLADSTAPAAMENQPPAESLGAADAGNDAQGNEPPPETPTSDPSGPQDGFINFATSSNTVFIGSSVNISGESVMYGNFKSVSMIIKGPYTEDEPRKPEGNFSKITLQASMDKDGKFSKAWNVGGTDGDFYITVNSSDGKASKTQRIRVNSWPDAGDLADSNIEQTNKAYVKLVKTVDAVKPQLSSKDAADLDKKMDAVKDKKDAAITLYTSINQAAKGLGALASKGKALPPNLTANLSDLNGKLSAQASDMERMNEFANHEPTGNTICEFLTLVNEACAAFSTITNLYTTGIGDVIQNIVLDKLAPATIGAANEIRSSNTGESVDPDKEAASKEAGKLFVTAGKDANSLTEKLGPAGLVGDLVQSVNSYFLRKYCGLYEGSIKHNYTVIFRNEDHEIWWKYGVEMEASFSLRYPKDKVTGRTIKMKGNIEGNAVKFTFFADSKAAVKSEMQGRDKFVDVMVLKDFLPVAVPFATSQHDKMGFGAAARAVATPAYFNIPMDAEYDLNAEKLKFFINDALVDFSDAVENRELFIVMAVLPMVRWQSYPIFKAQRMIKGSFKEKNEFPMTGGQTVSPQCIDKVTRHIGTETDPFEIFLNTSFAVKKQ